MNNQGLQGKYDEMHKQGATAWYGDGREERETILKMGEPWEGSSVLEIGCGEGDLVDMINHEYRCYAWGLDYSKIAIEKAQFKYPNWYFIHGDVGSLAVDMPFDRLVMQGVLEHLDDPFGELQWMIEHFKPKTVITSSPCFYNFRGIVWMTLDMLGAVMSKTDLHYLHSYQFADFCDEHGYGYYCKPCDDDWGNGWDMVEDLKQRIPLALKDGGLTAKRPIEDFIAWIKRCPVSGMGATMVYRIDIP